MCSHGLLIVLLVGHGAAHFQINCVFEKADLKGAIFLTTNLDKSDFRTAFNFNINPGINSLRNAKFSRNTLDGLLSNTKIIIE